MGTGIHGKHVLLTGASRGIGYAIAEKLADEQAKLTLVATNEARLADAAEAIRTSSGNEDVYAVACDLTDDRARNDMLDSARAGHGEISILINCAGVYHIDALVDADSAELDAMLAVNLGVPMKLCQAVVPAMIDAGFGAIINIGSIAGRKAFPMNSGYCASKFGLAGFSEALFEELREDGILVSYVSPGMTLTDMTSSIPGANPDKMVDPRDIADAIAWLLQTRPGTAPVNLDVWPLREVFDG